VSPNVPGRAVALLGLLLAAAPIARAQPMSATSYELRGPNGKTAAMLAMSPNGSPGLWLMDPEGRPRMSLGLYPENDFTPGLVLTDEKGEAVGLFRMAGPNHSPVVVFKADGSDRMILGLDMNDRGRAPFLTIAGEPGNRLKALEPGGGGKSEFLFTALIAFAAGALGGRLSSRRKDAGAA